MHWHHLKQFSRCTGVVRHGYMFPTVEAHSERALRLCELLLGLNTISTFFFLAIDRTMLFPLFVKSREWHTNRKAGVPAIVFSRAFQSIVSRLLVQLGKGSLSRSPLRAHDFLLVRRHVCVLWIGSSFKRDRQAGQHAR